MRKRLIGTNESMIGQDIGRLRFLPVHDTNVYWVWPWFYKGLRKGGYNRDTMQARGRKPAMSKHGRLLHGIKFQFHTSHRHTIIEACTCGRCFQFLIDRNEDWQVLTARTYARGTRYEAIHLLSMAGTCQHGVV